MCRSLALLLAVAPVACVIPSGRELTPADDRLSSLYFPTTVGAKWVYALGASEETWEAVAVRAAGGEKAVTVRKTAPLCDGQTQEWSTEYIVSERGLSVARDGERQWLLKLPLEEGRGWEYEEPGGGYVSLKSLAPQLVTVPAGTFPAARVEMTRHVRPFWGIGMMPPGGTFAPNALWIAPGVGIVKQSKYKEGREEPTMILKSFTPGKD